MSPAIKLYDVDLKKCLALDRRRRLGRGIPAFFLAVL